MSKKMLAFLLATTLIVSNVTVIHAEDTTSDEVATEAVVEEEKEEVEEKATPETLEVKEEQAAVAVQAEEESGEYLETEPKVNLSNEVSATDAVKASYEGFDKNNIIFLDLRAKEDYDAGHLKGAISAPVCLPASQGYKVPVAFRDALVKQVQGMDITGKKIYLSCYAGTFCVNYASDWLMSLCGIDESQLVRVLGGTFAINGDTALKENSVYLDEPAAKAISEVSATDAVGEMLAGNKDIIFLDLRASEDYEAGHLKGAISAPVCLPQSQGYGVTVALRDAFVEQIKGMNLTGKKVYLSCYAGTFCVNFATDWMERLCGIDESQLVRVLDGTFAINGDTALKENSIYVNPSYALNADGIILDVRAKETYYEGYVDGSLHQPLFKIENGTMSVTDFNDDLTRDFNKFVEANKDLLANNNIYILCNSGSRGADAARTLLKMSGIESNVHIIEGGANAMKTSNPSAFVKQQYVSSKDTIAAIGNKDIVIMDVRAAEGYAAGHIKGSVSYPVFDKNGVSNGYDDLAKAFLKKAGENAASLAGKKIYVICNSGARGAQIATKLLMQAGFSNANIYTVEGGYKGTDTDTLIKDNSTCTDPNCSVETATKPVTKNKAPKTGDSAPIMAYAFAMLAAAVVFVESKKRVNRK